jgi:hypothetical protein
MDPDDAADLIAELAPEMAERLLGRMEPDEAEDVRRLLNYAEFTAGGMMTPEPVILGHRCHGRRRAGAYPRHGTDPGAGLHGLRLPGPAGYPDRPVHRRGALSALLREPPSTLVSGLVDSELATLSDDANLHAVSRYFRDVQPGQRPGGGRPAPSDRRDHGG